MKSLKIDISDKDLAVIELVDEVGCQLQEAHAIFAENANGKQQDIADRLGLDKSRVSRMLSGFSNLTLKSLAELCWALDAKPSVTIQSNVCSKSKRPETTIAPTLNPAGACTQQLMGMLRHTPVMPMNLVDIDLSDATCFTLNQAINTIHISNEERPPEAAKRVLFHQVAKAGQLS